MTHIKSHLRMMGNKGRMKNASRPRLSGKVSAELTGGASVSRNVKIVSYKTVLNTCPSFLNEVMASEPLSGEQSDAVKECEMLCLG